ncbi:MAG: hypothetical protein LUE88_07315 [Clostridiales bacterium]|nr:hypothetical protein [Clostridiales bacterium]
MPIFVIGFLSGYPVGARLVSNLYADGKITKSTAEHMMAFSNNPGIVFIISAVSSSMLSDRHAAIFFIVICVFSALFTGIVYNILFPCRDNVNHISSVQNGTSIYAALSSSVRAVAMVGGCIIFFFAVTEAVINVLPISDGLVRGLIAGILEFTGGIGFLSALSYPKKIVYPLISALLCWGGFSVHLQTMALVESSNIDLRKYISCKAFSAAIAYFTAYFTFDMFFAGKADAVPTFNLLPSSPSVFAISSLLATVIYLWQKERRV